jgi:nifR3 family TIM-barrel protein
MAGVADKAFREICASFGACYTVGEMASANGIIYGSDKSEALLETGGNERPSAVQIFGADIKAMVFAARRAIEHKSDVIDINMGCPAPKIVNGGAGAALMRDITLAYDITRAVVSAAEDIPVTVKIRKGWDENCVNAVEFAKALEQAGASAITLHGRTRRQMYAPPVDLQIIADIKNAVSVPVIGNGDITDIKSAQTMYESTGCDLVMVGRGSLGNPWIFASIDAWARGLPLPPEPDIVEKMAVMLKHVTLACEYKGERRAVTECRKHIAWYVKGLEGAAMLRTKACRLSTLDEVKAFADEVVRQGKPCL